MPRILPLAVLIPFVVGCLQRIRYATRKIPLERPPAGRQSESVSEFTSGDPSQVIGGSRCGPQKSAYDLFEEAKGNAWAVLLKARCPGGGVVNSGPQKVKGSICTVEDSGKRGIRYFVTLDADQAEVQCRVKGAGQRSDNSL